MNKTEVLVRLRGLHEELARINEDLKATDDVDDKTIDALGQLVSDISEAMDKTFSENTSPGKIQDGLSERILTFESRHPRITKFLADATDLLGMLGI